MKAEPIWDLRLAARFAFLHTALVALLLMLSPTLARAGTWLPFGPKTYSGPSGKPLTVTDAFTLLNPTTQYTLRVFNGGLQGLKEKHASVVYIYLNEVLLVGPNNFSAKVSELDLPIFPKAANHISVQVRTGSNSIIAIEIVGVDNDPPIITASPATSPNGAGWYNSAVTVNFSCSDKTSGVASCPSPITVSTEGANQLVSGMATDLAGNTASASLTVSLDKTPPAISAAINPPPDALGFNFTPVTVTFTCADALSGVAFCPSPVSVTTDVLGDVISGTAIDVAGNTASTSVTVNISTKFFLIRSYTGKCLDYGTAPNGSGASVFLNDCSVAHPIMVSEIINRTDSQGNTFSHEVVLFTEFRTRFFGNLAIGIYNPPQNSVGGGPPPPSASQGSYTLELQPFDLNQASSANQIFRLDGDSIIWEGFSPCLNTPTNLCPSPPPPQFVLQVQNARGMNGSAIIAGPRNLADNEFWDFNAADGSGKYPTSGFMAVATNADLASKVSTAAWGSVIVVTGNDPNECVGLPVGPCIDLSLLAPIILNAGVTLRGTRRGINPGAQLYLAQSGSSSSTMLQVQGDYVRVTGLYLRGQSRATDESEPGTTGVFVGPAGPTSIPPFDITTTTEFIATIDHNSASDWGDQAFDAKGPFDVPFHGVPSLCTYPAFVDTANGLTYSCGLNDPGGAYNPGVQETHTVPNGPRLNITDDPTTLANVLITRNFVHHNERNNDGYGVLVDSGRALISRNTFLANRHAIAGGGEPHEEYRAVNNLVMSTAPDYGGVSPFNQDFDMHGTDNMGAFGGTSGYGGPGGYYVDIFEDTFLGTNRQNYWLRGFPSFETDFHRNVTLRTSQNDAVQFHHCAASSVCFGNAFPINVFDQSFNWLDPVTGRAFALGVGDFDGDGAEDLFLATGNTWFYSARGQTEWRYLNSAPDTIDQLLFGDFDGDGRTDVVAMRNGKLVISWGGISAFDPLNANLPPTCTSISQMAVGDFNGDGIPDILCADGMNWYVSLGGTGPFNLTIGSGFQPGDLRFGHFALCGGGKETDVFSVQSSGWNVSCGASVGWQPLTVSLTNTVNGLVVADFDGDGTADVGTFCLSGTGAPGWQISYGGAQGWSACNTFAGPQDLTNCSQFLAGLSSSCIALVDGVVGRFSGGPGADVLLWSYYNSQGGANLLDFPGGTGTPYQLSAPDVDLH